MPMTGFYNKSGHFEEDEDKDEGKEATMMPTSNDPASVTADEQSKGRRLNGAAKGRVGGGAIGRSRRRRR